MWTSRMVVGVVACFAFLVTGCMGMYEKESDQPRTMYSSLDATALVYSDPNSASAVDDHPFRWIGFVMHPIGLGMDYAVNRPVRSLASRSPALFGYTSEDSQLDAERTIIERMPN